MCCALVNHVFVFVWAELRPQDEAAYDNISVLMDHIAFASRRSLLGSERPENHCNYQQIRC